MRGAAPRPTAWAGEGFVGHRAHLKNLEPALFCMLPKNPIRGFIVITYKKGTFLVGYPRIRIAHKKKFWVGG